MIYICIPAHNEEQTVGVVLWKVRQVMADLERDYQLLVADDASTDKTADVLDPYTRVLPLTVYLNEPRRGYAASLEMLLREAVQRSEYPRRDVIIVLQADFTEEPDHIGALLRRVESGADIVTSNPAKEPWASWAQRGAHTLARLMLRRFAWPEGVSDPLTGLNAYRVSTVRRALEEQPENRLLRWEGKAANAALLLAAAPHARRVEGVEYMPRPERLQRPTRFQWRLMLREIFGLVRGRPDQSLEPVARLVPAAIRSARSHDRPLSSETLRAGRATTPASGPRRSARSRNGKPREQVKERPQRQRVSGEEKSTRKKKPPRGDPAVSADQAGTPPADAQEKRKRRRGGRRRRTGGDASVPKETAAPETVSEAGAEKEPPSAEAREAANAGRKRRRGRRGGRKRREGGGAVPPEQNQDQSSVPAPPEPTEPQT